MEFRGYQSTYIASLPPVDQTPALPGSTTRSTGCCSRRALPTRPTGSSPPTSCASSCSVCSARWWPRGREGAAEHSMSSLLFGSPTVSDDRLDWQDLPELAGRRERHPGALAAHAQHRRPAPAPRGPGGRTRGHPRGAAGPVARRARGRRPRRCRRRCAGAARRRPLGVARCLDDRARRPGAGPDQRGPECVQRRLRPGPGRARAEAGAGLRLRDRRRDRRRRVAVRRLRPHRRHLHRPRRLRPGPDPVRARGRRGCSPRPRPGARRPAARSPPPDAGARVSWPSRVAACRPCPPPWPASTT